MQNSQSGDEVAGRPIQESSSNALISVIAKKDVLSIGLNAAGDHHSIYTLRSNR
jgi:hypothetical protein